MSRSLPERPNLEQLRKQAKDLLKAQRQGDASVCPVLRRLSRFAGASDEDVLKARLSLAEAQLALAREYGFKSWAALMRRVRKGPAAGEGWTFTEALVAAGATIKKEPWPATLLIPTLLTESGCRCYLCDNPATIHVTERSEGKMTEQHYCVEHAEKVGLAKEKYYTSNMIYPVKYSFTVPLTQDQLDRHESIPVTLPDGSVKQIRFPRDATEGMVMAAGPKPGAAEKYSVRFVLKIIRPPAQR